MSDCNCNVRSDQESKVPHPMFSHDTGVSNDMPIRHDSNNDDGFEEHIIDYKRNPFGGATDSSQSRKYIDDMTSSSGILSGLSENDDCLPMVEQVHDDYRKSTP